MKKMIYTVSMLALCNLAQGGEIARSVLVETAQPKQMVLHQWISAYGTVAPAQGAAMNLNFPKAGRISRLLVSPGQRVAKGEALLEISAEPAGRLAYSQAVNAAEFSRGELERVKSLYAKQMATRSQVDAAARNLKDAEGALLAMREMGEGMTQDRLLSPFDGIVSSVALAAGDRFPAGANLVQVIRKDHLVVRLGVSPWDGRLLASGMKAHLASVFSPQDVAKGEITQIAGQTDPQTQLIDVTVRFKEGTLLPGIRVRGDIEAESRKVQAVPRQAILRDVRGAYLFQVQAGKAHRINISAGLEENGWVEVQAPHLPDQPVVTLGNYELEDNIAVREAGR